MRSSIRAWFAAAPTVVLAAALAACGTAPLSYLDGHLLDRSTLNRYPVRIVSVDGQIEFRNPVQVAPGEHWVVVEAAPGGGVRLQSQQSFVLKVEPCTRYYLAADRRSPLLEEWQLVVERTEPVGSCDPQEEMKKARPPGA
jgi:hypothetical protein